MRVAAAVGVAVGVCVAASLVGTVAEGVGLSVGRAVGVAEAAAVLAAALEVGEVCCWAVELTGGSACEVGIGVVSNEPGSGSSMGASTAQDATSKMAGRMAASMNLIYRACLFKNNNPGSSH
jgi:hypothetical protein